MGRREEREWREEGVGGSRIEVGGGRVGGEDQDW